MTSFSDLIKADKPVLVDFTAAWCGPCKMMAPILEQVKQRVGEKATIIKVDIDQNPNAAGVYNVHSVPTLIVFKKGQIKWRQSGVIPAEQLAQVIEQNI